MVIGIAGVVGAGKSSVLREIKRTAKEKYIYIDVNKLFPFMVQQGGACHAQLIKELGHKNISNAKGRIYYKPLRRRFFEDEELFFDFMRIVYPYISSYIDKLKKAHPDKIIFVISTYLFDFNWHEKCDRIVCVDTDFVLRMRRLKKCRKYPRYKYDGLLARSKSDEYMREHSDYILHNNDADVLKEEIKQMMVELHQFKKMVDMGLIPLK